jgi:hypothetical protein
VTLKNAIFWDVMPHVALVRTDILEEYELLVTTNVVPSSLILSALMKDVICFSEMSVLMTATLRHIPKDGILHKTSCLAPRVFKHVSVELCIACDDLCTVIFKQVRYLNL